VEYFFQPVCGSYAKYENIYINRRGRRKIFKPFTAESAENAEREREGERELYDFYVLIEVFSVECLCFSIQLGRAA